MLNTLLSNCWKQNNIKTFNRIPKRLFGKKKSKRTQKEVLKETKNLDLKTENEMEEMKIDFITKQPNQMYDTNEYFVHKSGLAFASLFEEDCDSDDIQEIFEAVQYLLKASQGDLTKIRRFYVTVIVLAIHSSSLDPKIKASLRKHFQLTDETKWRESPLLKLCEAFNFIITESYAKSVISFHVDKARLRSLITLKSYLAQAIKAGIPDLEPWDLKEYQNQVKTMKSLIENPKGKFIFILIISSFQKICSDT
jgi:hypothetical protein